MAAFTPMRRSEWHRSLRNLLFAFGVLMPLSLQSQEAALEVSGVHGECTPVLASTVDELVIHRSPDLRSRQLIVPYRKGWRIPFVHARGVTRVLSIGKVRAITLDRPDNCTREQTVFEYLHYVGEGYASLRANGTLCEAFVADESEGFEVIELPEVQAWISLIYADGTSPGWILYDYTQFEAVGIEC